MSSTLKKTGNLISDTFNGIVNGVNTSVNTTPYNNLVNYYSSLNTQPADMTYQNMAQNALNLSGTLSNRPDYIYSVDGSDSARERAENATYQSYVDKLTPAFNTQVSDLQTRLLNQGLSAGSEAYQRAMGDLYNAQNDALNQAAYKSVTAGQEAFSNALKDSINSANFQNKARTLPIAELYSLLLNTPSTTKNNENITALQNQVANINAQNALQNYQNAQDVLGGFLKLGNYFF